MDSCQSETLSPEKMQGVSTGGLQRILERMVKVADAMAIASLFLLLAVVFAMILARDAFNWGLPWLDDLARYVQIWAVYTAAISVTMKGEHIAMDAVYVLMPGSWRLTIRRLTGLLSLAICAITGFLAFQQAVEVVRLREVSASGVFPAILGYASLPFGFFLMIGASLYYFIYRSGQENMA